MNSYLEKSLKDLNSLLNKNTKEIIIIDLKLELEKEDFLNSLDQIFENKDFS